MSSTARSTRAIATLIAISLLLTGLIVGQGTTRAEAQTITRISEDFEGTYPPTGWAIDNADVTSDGIADGWDRFDSCALGFGKCIQTIGVGDRARMPEFSTSGMTSPTLSFNVRVVDPDPSANGVSLAILDDGPSSLDGLTVNSQYVGGIYPDTSPSSNVGTGNNSVSIPLAVNMTYKLRFRATTTTSGGLIQLDNIVVSGTSATPTPAPVNHVPIAIAGSATVDEDIPSAVSFSAVDAGGDPLTYSIVSQPTHGTLNFTGGFATTAVYTSAKDYAGTDSFQFVAKDPSGQTSAPATVSITVNAVNDAPEVKGPNIEQTGAGQPIYFIGKNGFTVSDVDAGTSEVELRVISNAAPVSMQHKNGLTFTTGDGTEDSLIVAKGTIADINNSLTGIFWSPARNLTGKHFMTVAIDDLGNTGKGGSKITEGPVEIEVRSGPDASIGVKGKDGSFKGLDLYNMDATDQTLRTDAQYTYLNRPRRIEYRVRNVGLTMETFTVSLATVGTLLEYKAFDDFGDNVTKALDNGTYEVVVPAGGVRTVDLQVTLARPPTAAGETQRLTLTTRGPTPTNQPNAQPVMDVVAAEVGPVEHKPDLLISNNGQQATAAGDNVYSDHVDGKQKVTVPAVDPGGAESFFVWIQNDSAVPDTLRLKLEQYLPAGLRLAIYDDFSEVTSQVLNGTYELTDMAPGATKRLRIAAVASSTAKFNGVPGEVFIQAIPKDNSPGTPVDSVSADIEVAADRQPDLFIFSEQDPDRRLVGWQYTEAFERRQIVREEIEPGVDNWYEVWVSNDTSGTTGTFNLQGRLRDATPGYELRFFTADPRHHPDPQYDVTSQVISGRYEVELKHLHSMRLWVRVLGTDKLNPRGFPGYIVLETFAVDGLPKNRDRAAIELYPQKYQPDLQISPNNGSSIFGSYLGKDIYSINGGSQKGTVTIGGGESAAYLLKIENDGVLRGEDEIAIKSSPAANGFTVKYYKNYGSSAATDITSDVLAGTYSVKVSALAGYASYITAVVTAPSDVAPTMDSVFVTARSVKSRYGTGGRSDVATLNTVSAYRPDLAVVGAGGLQVGQGITNRTGATQTVTIDANIGSPYKGQFVVWNGGSSPDSFKVDLVGDPKAKGSLSENASASPTLTYTTPVIQPGMSAVVPFRAVLPSRTKQGTLFEFTATATSVTRPGALNDVTKLILKGKVTCSTAPISFDTVRISTQCSQATDDGWLLSKDTNINGLDFVFGSNVAFLDKTTKTISAENVTIYANTLTKIYSGPLNDMPLGKAATLNGVGTSSQVYGMAIGPGLVEIDTSKNPAGVKLPLRPLAVFSGGQPSTPLTIPTSGNTQAPANQLQITWPALRLYTLELADIKTVYDPTTRRWIGYGRVGMPNLPIPKVPAFEIALSSGGGSLDFAFIKMKAGVLGVPIGTTATITGFEAAVDARDGFSVYGKVNADLAPTPVTVPGKGEKKLPLFSVDGKFAYTNREGSKFTIQGNAKLLSFLTFGSFTATVQTDGAMRMTGHINHSIDIGFGTIGTSTTVDGAVDSSGKFYLQGDGRACVVGVCVGISGVVSSKGIAVCGSVKLWKTYGFGFGMHWSDASSLSAFSGCDLSNYKDAAAPTHIDFDALSKRTEDLLSQVDNIRQQIANVTSQIQNVGGPAF